MPTGYTADVGTGNVTDFPTFAMQCARAFGALVTMRDEPISAPIPDRFQPSDYHAKRLDEARQWVRELRAMTQDEVASARDAAAATRDADNTKRKLEVNARRARYEAMLSQVNAWEPPTAEHVGMKDFMRSQLEESIRFDCTTFELKTIPDPSEWHRTEIADAIRDIEYHASENAKEIERTASRNAWVSALRSSLSEQA